MITFAIFRELSRFIAAGRLHCKIDKVGGIVETNRPDSKNWQYQVWTTLCLFVLRSNIPVNNFSVYLDVATASLA